MCVTLKLLFLGVILKGVVCQYITHPFGGFSYFTNTHFQPAVGYSYVAPTGQKVNVKFGTSALVQPAHPPITATHNHHVSPFVFSSAITPAPVPLSTEFATNPQQQFSSFQAPQTQPLTFDQNLVSRRLAGPPRPESLFVPASGFEQLASDKQIQAYNDYIEQLDAENTGSTTESQTKTNFDLDPESFIDINFDEKI